MNEEEKLIETISEELVKANTLNKMDWNIIQKCIGAPTNNVQDIVIKQTRKLIKNHNKDIDKKEQVSFSIVDNIEKLAIVLSHDNTMKYIKSFDELAGKTEKLFDYEDEPINDLYDFYGALVCHSAKLRNEYEYFLDMNSITAVDIINNLKTIILDRGIKYDDMIGNALSLLNSAMMSNIFDMTYDINNGHVFVNADAYELCGVCIKISKIISILDPLLKLVDGTTNINNVMNNEFNKNIINIIDIGPEQKAANNVASLLLCGADAKEIQENYLFKSANGLYNSKNIELLEKILKKINKEYIKETKVNMQVEKAVNGLIILNDLFDCSNGIKNSMFVKSYIEETIPMDDIYYDSVYDLRTCFNHVDHSILINSVNIDMIGNVLNMPFDELNEMIKEKTLENKVNLILGNIDKTNAFVRGRIMLYDINNIINLIKTIYQ